MKRQTALAHEFVEFMPDQLKDGILYVSMPFATVAHKCCCGCGHEVVTPLSPTDWKLIFDGQSVSLDPSIGNWSFPCKSHYWVRNGKIRWSTKWTQEEVDAGKAADRMAKQRYFGGRHEDAAQEPVKRPFWHKLKWWNS
jgi:Family of unknown function (DUF6527)